MISQKLNCFNQLINRRKFSYCEQIKISALLHSLCHIHFVYSFNKKAYDIVADAFSLVQRVISFPHQLHYLSEGSKDLINFPSLQILLKPSEFFIRIGAVLLAIGIYIRCRNYSLITHNEPVVHCGASLEAGASNFIDFPRYRPIRDQQMLVC